MYSERPSDSERQECRDMGEAADAHLLHLVQLNGPQEMWQNFVIHFAKQNILF